MGEPNWPNLPQMPPTQLLPKRRGQLAPTYAFARHLAIGVGMDGQRPCRTLAEDPGRTQPRAAYPRAAAQTRVVSLAGIRLRSWESARVFKGIICADVSEFESYMPSHAVGLSQVRGKHFPAPTAPAAWVAGPAAQIRICSNGKKLSGSCQYIFQARLAVARVVWLCFAHVERHFDQYR